MANLQSLCEMAGRTVELQTRLGRLRGQVRQSVLSDNPYYSFQGIPYGKPPVGDLRFKSPQPFGSWEGTRDALDDGTACIQSNVMPIPAMGDQPPVVGDEDCLFINVFVNELPEKSKSLKPVMVNIHGGGFYCGSGSSKFIGPDLQLECDVVYVAFNYRLGAFGFLSLEDKEAPGNAGMKDQVLALRWVRDNIDSFGGDPDNVTILGISAGGASVHHLLLSPAAKGLFHKAIIQSGFSSSIWSIQHNPRRNALLLAKELGCSFEDDKQICKFLQSVAAQDIVAATKTLSEYEEFQICGGMIFSPCVEPPGPDAFYTEWPDKIMAKGAFNKVPVILGGTSNEGNMFLIGKDEKVEKLIDIMSKNPKALVPSFLNLKDDEQVTKEILECYFNGLPPSTNNIVELMKYFGDIAFYVGMDKARTSLLQHSSQPVFTYLFTDHSKCLCQSNDFPIYGAPNLSNIGTCHGADFAFLYTSLLVSPPEDKMAISKHVNAWARFAKTSDPNCQQLDEEWMKDSEKNPCFMEIGKKWEMREGIPLKERIAFWRNLTLKYSKV